MLLTEAFHMFIREKKMKGCYESTIKTYGNVINDIFIKYTGDIDTEELTQETIEDFIIMLRNRDISMNTVKNYWTHVSGYIRFLYRSGHIPDDYTIKIPTMSTYKPLKPIYMDDEIQMLFKNIKGKSEIAWQKRAVFAILLDTGIRVGELAKIELDDIDRVNHFMKVRGSKGHEDRRVPLSMPTMNIIDNYLKKRTPPINSKNSRLMFRNSNFEPIGARTVRSYVHTHLKRYGVDKATVHLFRHTFITRKCLETDNAFFVQQLAGHKELKTTLGYYQEKTSFQLVNVSLMPIPQLLATIVIK